MSRLRQINSQNYNSSHKINEEFENIVRYLNASEFGNKTISELLDVMFDDDGEFDAKVELRLDTSAGIQYRSGEYDDPETGWITIVSIDEIRGNSGQNIGLIGEPVFNNRYEFTAAGGETEIDLAHVATDQIMVYKNGLLQIDPTDYTTDEAGGTASTGSVTFGSALALDDEIAMFVLYDGAEFDVNRSDFVVSGSQSNFGFAHDDNDAIQVFKNGILQKEGGTEDYYRDAQNDLVLFVNPVGDTETVSIVSVSSLENRVVAGLMIEADYTDNNGYINYAKLAIADGEITQAKVQDLVSTLAATPDITISASTPDPVTRFWIDTSSTPNQLKFYDGSSYLSANPASAVPSFDSNQASQFMSVDPTGSFLEFSDIDFSSLIPKTQRGAANGVATLGSDSRVPATQLPTYITYVAKDYYSAGAESDGFKRIARMFKHEVEIYAIDYRVDSGTCSIQLDINGATTGSVYAVSNVPANETLSSPVVVDATSDSKLIGIQVTSSAAPVNLDVVLSIRIKSQ